MAQLFLSTVSGPKETMDVGLEDHSPSKQIKLNDNSKSSVSVDACDLFQCGQCLKLFTSLGEFVLHKEKAHSQDDIWPEYHEGETRNGLSNNLSCVSDSTSSESFALTQVSSSFRTSASNIFCDNQLYKDDIKHSSVELFESNHLKVTSAFENVELVSNGGLPVNLVVPGSIYTTDISYNVGEVVLLNDSNNNNESETVCENVSLEYSISECNNLKCNYCNKEFRKVHNLKQHIRSHTGERPYHCVLCGKTFTQISNAKKHITSHKVWPEPWESTSESVNLNENPSTLTASLFSCRYCPLAFNCFSELKNHRKVHSSLKVFKCMLSECNESFKDVDSLTVHLYGHTYATFQCSQCQLGFPSFAKLSQHRLSHSNESLSMSPRCTECKEDKDKGFECPLCSKILSTDETLKRHLTTHIQRRSHPCPAPNCPKYFSSLKTAKSHYIHTHLPTSHSVRHQCHICSASFKRYDNLIRHGKVHKSSLQFKCPFIKAGCFRTFSRKDVLKNHILTHKKKKQSCLVCNQQIIIGGSWLDDLQLSCCCPCNTDIEQDSMRQSAIKNLKYNDVKDLCLKKSVPNFEINNLLSNHELYEAPEIYTKLQIQPKPDDLKLELSCSNTLIMSNDGDLEFGGAGEIDNAGNSCINPGKSFVLSQDGNVNCDDENTIEIIVGIA